MNDDAYEDAFELVARRFESLAMLSTIEDEIFLASKAERNQDDGESIDSNLLREATGMFLPVEDASSLPAGQQEQSIGAAPGDSQIIPSSPCPSLDQNIMSPGIPNTSFAGEMTLQRPMCMGHIQKNQAT
jgi:hypothetical protein